MQNHDIRGALEHLKRLDLAEGRLVVVDLFESNDEAVGEPPALVHVGVGASADALENFVLLDDFGSGMDTPAPIGWIHLQRSVMGAEPESQG